MAEPDPSQLRHDGRNLDNPVVVDSDVEVVPVEQAAEQLSLSIRRVRVLANSGFLEPARRPGEDVGVTERSIEIERRWRDEAGVFDRLRRFGFHLVRNVS